MHHLPPHMRATIFGLQLEVLRNTLEHMKCIALYGHWFIGYCAREKLISENLAHRIICTSRFLMANSLLYIFSTLLHNLHQPP